MPETPYREALKLGKKEYRSCVSKGCYPYLPALEELLPEQGSSGEKDLGLTSVPAEFITGTRTRGRANVFARNFMPLAGENSEFAQKWERLCQSHLKEGIRDPIKVYEYMNRYYVEEGNKRVSVLKFYGAVTIPARVIRVLPVKNDAPEQRRYFELLDFYRLSGVNFLEFCRAGSAQRLQKLLGKAPGQVWTPEERSAFTTAYYAFRAAFLAQGGEDLHLTAGDAMLAFLEVYGVDSLRGKSAGEIRKTVASVWEEIVLRQEEAPIHVKLSPPEKKPGLLTKVLSVAEPKVLRAAFLYDGDPTVSGWTASHEQGREYVQAVMEGALETTPFFHVLDRDPAEVMEEAVRAGNTVLFATSPRLLPASLKAAVAHPEVTVFTCCLNTSHRYIRTYYARMYEAKFISGAIAGSLAGGEDLGYLCDYPIFGQIAGINAFALGAQMVNPRVKVFLEWSSVGGSDAALSRLTGRGIRLVSSQDLVRRGDEWRSLGLSLITGDRRVNLATPRWEWGVYYEKLLRQVQNHSEEAEYRESGKALNYYWGMSAGAVDIDWSETLPPATGKLAELLRDAIRAGILDPFREPVYTRTGKVPEENCTLRPETVIGMDFLVENVVGEIPPYEAISDVGKATVDQVGVERATKDASG